jgi:uncharacterized membrane protein YfcA
LESSVLLVVAGLLIGFTGTLIGAGGGFVLVPLLLYFYPELSPEIITAVSIAVVAANAISGSVAYSRSGRIDYKAGIQFALYTIPGSILGVFLTKYISGKFFDMLFGAFMLILSVYLFLKEKDKLKKHFKNI